MNRRAILAALAALAVRPSVAPASACDTPWLYFGGNEYRDLLRLHLREWATNNPHVLTAHVAISPEHADLVPEGGVIRLGKKTFHVFAMTSLEGPPPLGLPLPLWGIKPSCGDLL